MHPRLGSIAATIGTLLILTPARPNPGCAAAEPPQGTSAGELVSALREDATLRDVFFVNSQLGWAVGDHGAIWHTSDGGRRWSLQDSKVDCSLTSVVFLDESTGWAAGGITDPHTFTTRGVLLRTHDGGQTWVSWKRALLPGLLRIKFADAQQGWAIGQTSDAFPQALFATDDGGRTWTPLSLAASRTWRTGDFVNALQGAVAARDGMLGAIDRRAVSPARNQFAGIRSFRDLVLTDDQFGCAVGEGDLVVTTRDAGATWQDRSAALPGTAARDVDFVAVSAVQSHLWIAGSPGAHVFYSPDGGTNWTAQATGQMLPLHALHFVDARHGWAVGALGTILSTSDGGAGWLPQHGGRRRAAWLGFFGDAEQVPLELVAQLSAGDGYTGALDILARRDMDPAAADDTNRDLREREALIAAGASSVDYAWQFPVRHSQLGMPASKIIAIWDAVNHGSGQALLERHMVNQLRMWRPDVVITVSSSPRGTDPLAHLINQTVQTAVRKAAEQDPDDPIAAAGLAPWLVKRVFTVLPTGSVGTVSVASDQLIPALGRSLTDFVARPRGMIHRRHVTAPTTTRLQLLDNDLPGQQGGRDVFGGLNIPHNSDARRAQLAQPLADIHQLRRDANRLQIVQAIIASTATGQAGGQAWMAQINNLTMGMHDAAAAEALFHLATRYHQLGQWPLAVEVHELLADKYRNQPQAAAAMAWLVTYHSSFETAHITRADGAPTIQRVSAQLTDANKPTIRPPEQAVSQPEQSFAPSAARAGVWAKRLREADYMLFARPQLRLAMAAAQRRDGQRRQAERAYLALQRSRPRDAWWQCAADELWLEAQDSGKGDDRAAAIKPVHVCRRTAEKPRLDGQLAEPCWGVGDADLAAAPVRGLRLTSPLGGDDTWPASVFLCYDDEYLYLGVACRQAKDAKYASSDKPRPRDADLRAHDRIEFLLDVDRDRATFYRLSVDHRGWTSESCWGNDKWDPTWYVAAAVQGEVWTCEAAIPLAELGIKPSRDDGSWALGVQRVVPGVGFQSWTQPASPDILPQGFGHLQFD